MLCELDAVSLSLRVRLYYHAHMRNQTEEDTMLERIQGMFIGVIMGPIGAFGLLKEALVGREPPTPSGNGAGAWIRLGSDIFGLIWILGSIVLTLAALPFFGLSALWIGPAAMCALGGLFMLFGK